MFELIDAIFAGGDGTCLASTAKVADAQPEKEISEPDLQFLKSLNPQSTVPELKTHALDSFARGMNSGGIKYRCFQSLYHLLPAITDHYLYPSLISQGSHKGLLLDLGGGQGTDARKLIQDGWPADQIVISDVETFLWNVGLDLFQDGPTGPVRFINANILNAADIEPGGPLHDFLGAAGGLHHVIASAGMTLQILVLHLASLLSQIDPCRSVCSRCNRVWLLGS